MLLLFRLQSSNVSQQRERALLPDGRKNFHYRAVRLNLTLANEQRKFESLQGLKVFYYELGKVKKISTMGNGLRKSGGLGETFRFLEALQSR